jgi:DNA (cytosine-5)-methyltransferase 1
MGNAASIMKKVRRFAEGGKLRTLDLFAGCGGFSLGFHRAGFSILGAIEADAQAMASHAMNFSQDHESLHAATATAIDIVNVEPSDYLKAIGIKGSTQQAIDVLIGGPPCQAFARIGRAKLRDVAKDPKAHQYDKRANLVAEYIRFVEALRPLALVIENVPDMMNQGGVNVVANVCEVLSKLGYICRYTLLNAASYGVPQFRERVFIIGFHKSLNVVPSFPSATHALDLPQGYLGTRHVAMKPINDSGRNCKWFIELQESVGELKPAVCCLEALDDLPKINDHLKGDMPRGVRRLDTNVKYSTSREVSEFAIAMREWPGFSTDGLVNSHVIRSLPRDYETFRRMRPGDQYPEAYEVAVGIYREEIARLNDGQTPHSESQDADDLWNRFVPPYDPGKFPNKWWKLDPKRPSRTLTAHIGKDTYSHIHYDSRQARTISVREAARLQSFPDGFQFAGAMNAAFRQIGNAVPPLLSFAVAKQVRGQLKQLIQITTQRA